MRMPFPPLAGAVLSLFSAAVAAQSSAPPPRHVQWQRSLADALAEQQRTGLPLLIAVNTQGEVFNDRFAGTVYRDPEFVDSTAGYVCVVASPDRHNELDYDADGNRIECPKFPGCTCSEHIQIEPALYARWFDGNRVAPRHIAVGTDGKKRFDRFLDNSMALAIKAIAEHRGNRPDADPVPAALAELVQRRGAAARRALEDRFRAGDRQTRVELLRAAAQSTAEPFDLLRMGLRDRDDAVFGAAASSLAALATAAQAIDLEDALARTTDREVETRLVAKLAELGRNDPALARLASHFDRVGQEPLPAPWRNPWQPAAFDGDDRDGIEAELDRCEARLKAEPNDQPARLRLATAQAALGLWLAARSGRGAELWLDDAARNAGKVVDAALANEAAALVALSAWHRGDAATAGAALARALGARTSSRQPDAWLATQTLGAIARGAAQNAYAKAEAQPTVSLRTELLRTQAVLDLMTARNVRDEATELLAMQLLEFAGRRADARLGLQRLVDAFPGSATAHDRWRNRLIVDLGTSAMRDAYGQFVARATDTATARWFAGYADLVAGEHWTRTGRRDDALTAYAAAIDHLLASVAGNEEFAASAHHFAVLALAGRAELRHAAGDSPGAVADLLRAAELHPDSLDSDDGLGRKPRAIAARIARELAAAGKTELGDRLRPILP